MIEKLREQFTKYEVARILGARALQLAMDAPVLLKIEKEKLEELNYDVIRIAEMELESGVLPITVKKPFPKKREEKLKKPAAEELQEKKKEEEKKIQEKEVHEEKEIQEEGEIMELAQPEDELEAEESAEEEA